MAGYLSVPRANFQGSGIRDQALVKILQEIFIYDTIRVAFLLYRVDAF